jgi:hypothetical protein
MSVRDKQSRRLVELEAELRQLLERELTASAQTGAISSFVTREANPSTDRWLTGRHRVELLTLVEEIEQLQRDLGKPIGWLCVRYREFCRTLFDREDHHRLGPKRLAAQFLGELQAASPGRR